MSPKFSNYSFRMNSMDEWNCIRYIRSMYDFACKINLINFSRLRESCATRIKMVREVRGVIFRITMIEINKGRQAGIGFQIMG